jgi:hypothetical protein
VHILEIGGQKRLEAPPPLGDRLTVGLVIPIEMIGARQTFRVPFSPENSAETLGFRDEFDTLTYVTYGLNGVCHLTPH